MIQALDGPSKQHKLSAVGTATPVEVKDGANPAFDDRKVVTMQGDGKFYVYFANEDENPNATTVSTNGFIQFKDTKETYEAGDKQAIFVLAVSGTVDIRVAERA